MGGKVFRDEMRQLITTNSLNHTYLDCSIHSHRLEENKSKVSVQG